MSESTLNLKKADLMAKTARHLGWSRSSDDWSPDQKEDLKEFVDSACRRVYQAAIGGKTFDWSWLRPVSDLILPEGEHTILLPDDFGGIEGRLTFSPTAGSYNAPIKLVNEQVVMDYRAGEQSSTGYPYRAAIQWLTQGTEHRSPRAQLIFDRTADTAYTFRLQYYILPQALTDAFPYALGGANLAEVYLEGCLAVAEQRHDNIPPDSPMAIHQKEFARLLAAAIDQDRRHKPQSYGRNADRSDEIGYVGAARHTGEYVTFDGVLYEPA